MTDLERLAELRRRYPENAHLPDVPYMLELLKVFRAVLTNMVEEFNKLPDPKPDFEAYTIEHARWLTGPRADTLDTPALKQMLDGAQNP